MPLFALIVCAADQLALTSPLFPSWLAKIYGMPLFALVVCAADQLALTSPLILSWLEKI